VFPLVQIFFLETGTRKYHADIGKAGSFLMARSYDIFLHPPRFVGRLLSRPHALAAQPVISGDLW
jgi:hypothetical protein